MMFLVFWEVLRVSGECPWFSGGVPGFLGGVPGFRWCSGIFGCSGIFQCSGVPGSTTCQKLAKIYVQFFGNVAKCTD